MSWKLIFALSGFGLAMAIATVFVIPSSIEPLFWLAIFVVSAWLIAKKAPGKYFLHGFCVSLVNCVWITGAHIAHFLGRCRSERRIAEHARDIFNADLNYSIITTRSGDVLDGAHRIARAFIEGKREIQAVVLDDWPPPAVFIEASE